METNQSQLFANLALPTLNPVHINCSSFSNKTIIELEKRLNDYLFNKQETAKNNLELFLKSYQEKSTQKVWQAILLSSCLCVDKTDIKITNLFVNNKSPLEYWTL